MVNLSVVILSYNTRELTTECLRSIALQCKKELEKKELEIIVVDNNSSDDSVKNIEKLDYINLIQSKENLGFGKGCNLGAKNAKGKYVLFLNSDTQIKDNGFFEMVKFMEKDSRVAILGGKLKNDDGSTQPSAGKFYNLFNLILMLLSMERLGFLRSSPNEIKKVDWISGACMMVKSDIFKKLSGFNEKLFMYVEDMEICYRAKKLGYDTYFYPDIKLIHKSLGSSNRTFAIINIYRGILWFYSRHETRFEYLVAKTLLILKAKIVILIGTIAFNSKLKERYEKAMSEL